MQIFFKAILCMPHKIPLSLFNKSELPEHVGYANIKAMAIFKKNQEHIQHGLMSSMVLNVIHEGILIIDHAGIVKLINPAAESILDVVKDEVLNLNYGSAIQFIDKDGAPIPDNQNPIAINLHSNQYLETKDLGIMRPKSNEKIPVWLAIASTCDTADCDRVITLRDIAKEVKENQARSEFISTASHEMRTPVASIEGYIGLALSPQTATIDIRARSYLMKAHESSQHLGKLFRDLLDTTKLDDGRLKANLVPVEMTSLVKSISDGMAPSVAAKGLKYFFGENPAGTSAALKLSQILYSRVDINFLREVLDNLIDNAIKYTANGAITVALYGDNDNVIIYVADTGIGISREDQSHIFQKFYRADNSDTRTIGGTGLGLYVTKQRVDSMHGRVWVESEPGKGSKFFVSLPRISNEEYQREKIAIDNPMILPKKVEDIPDPASVFIQPTPQPQAVTPSPPPPPPPVSPTPSANPDSNTQPAASNLSPAELAKLKQNFAQNIQGAGPKNL